jgi:hypothetical protein
MNCIVCGNLFWWESYRPATGKSISQGIQGGIKLVSTIQTGS